MATGSARGPISRRAIRPASGDKRVSAQRSPRRTWLIRRRAVAVSTPAARSGSDLEAPVQGNDAEHHVEEIDPLETDGLHHGLQRLLVGVDTDRFCKVAVTGLVLRHQLPDARNDPERIEIVSWRERLPDLRELGHQQA